MIASAPDLMDLARSLAEGRSLCFLDSASGGGRAWAFWDPVAVYSSKDGEGLLRWADGRVELSHEDPFLWLAAFLRRRPDLTAAGYWSYDLRYHTERLPHIARDDLQLPDCWVGLYEGARQRDGFTTETRRHGAGTERGGEQSAVSGQQSGIAGRHTTPPLHHHPTSRHRTPTAEHRAPIPEVSRPEYEQAVRRVLEYIAAGDCYQVNLSQRFRARLSRSPWELYESLRRISPAPYAAFLDCGDHQVLSSSPELFLKVAGREVETRPIKGTRPRGKDPEEDRARAAELLASEKDRAELVMIVDLERNDLGRVCEYGSVRVPELYRLESYANVHHLVATVRGRLRPEVGPLECLRAAFPGGSITGAPKIRAMEIIEELEPVRRGVYTGAVGWVDGRGNAEWNIAIRTMVVRGRQVYFHAGGGIVADSDPAAEYEETLAKAAGMVRALDE